MDFAGIWKKRAQVYATPSYYAFRMYSTAEAVRPVQVKTDLGSYSIRNGVLQMADIPDVLYLDLVATLNAKGNVLTLFCVNRSIDRDLNAEIHLGGFQAKKETVKILRADSIYSGNDETDPKRVVPADSEQAVASDVIPHVFPHESVTLIAFRKE